MNHSQPCKIGPNKMNHRLIALDERLEAACVELLSIAECYFGREVVTGPYGKEIAKIPEGPSSRNQKRIATQLAILNSVFMAMEEMYDVGQEQCEYGVDSMVCNEQMRAVVKLSVPKSPAEAFRRSLLRGLFNAVRVRMPDKSMQSMRLGVLWFKSADDPVMSNVEIPE